MPIATITEHNTALEQLVLFENELDKMEQKGIVGIAENKQQFEKVDQTGELFPVIWDRLYRLGYLPTKYEPGSHVNKLPILEKAVYQLQQEAGLNPDGWIGLQTWTALQQLFAFEHDANLTTWQLVNSGKLFNRAVELRMATLGIISEGEVRSTGRDITKPLSNWRTFLLNVTNIEKFKTSTELELIEWMFDLAKLSRLVAQKFDFICSPALTAKVHFPTTLFVKYLLKIELWLCGYDGFPPGRHGAPIPIAYSPKSYRMIAGKKIQLSLKKRSTNLLSSAIADFLTKANVRFTIAPTELKLIQHCFSKLILLDANTKPNAKMNSIKQPTFRLSASPAITKFNTNLSVAENIKQLNSKESIYLQHELNKPANQSIGARVFDGFKRGWQWFKQFITASIDSIKNKVYWLAKTVKKIIIDSTSVLRRVFKMLSDGISVFINKEIPGSTLDLAIRRYADSDFKVFIADTVPTQQVAKFIENYNALIIKSRAALEIAMALLTMVLKIGKSYLAGPIGMVLILTEFYKISRSLNIDLIKQGYAKTS